MAKRTSAGGSGRKKVKKKEGKIDRYGPVRAETIKKLAADLELLLERASMLAAALAKEGIDVVEGVDGYKSYEKSIDGLKGFLGDVSKKAQRQPPNGGNPLNGAA